MKNFINYFFSDRQRYKNVKLNKCLTVITAYLNLSLEKMISDLVSMFIISNRILNGCEHPSPLSRMSTCSRDCLFSSHCLHLSSQFKKNLFILTLT